MTSVVVTGGSGKLGRAVVRELVEHGYEVVNADLAPPADPADRALAPFVKVDLEDHGQALEVFSHVDERVGGLDAIVHLAAIPAPGLSTDGRTFHLNTLSTYHVFDAARRFGITNVVWASSETVLGLPLDEAPERIPLDEAVERPNSSYSLSKLLGEEMARQFCRWVPELKIVGLRFSNVLDDADYRAFPGHQGDATIRKWNLWGYIDHRDGAQAVRRGLELETTGADHFVIAANDTVMDRPNDELVAEVFPGVPYESPADPHGTLLSIEKARRVLGFEPQHTWRTGTTTDA